MLVALEYVSMGHGLKFVELVTHYGIISLLVLSALVLDSHLMVMCLSMSSLSTPKSEGFLPIIPAFTSFINFVAYVFSV